MPDETQRTWLTRCNDDYCDRYHFYHGNQPSREKYVNGIWGAFVRSVDAKIFHQRYPHVKLERGAGPIEIIEEIYEIRNGKVIRD